MPPDDTKPGGAWRRQNPVLRFTLAGLPELDLFPSREAQDTALWELGKEAGGSFIKDLLPGILIVVFVAMTAQVLAQRLLTIVVWPPVIEEIVHFLLVAAAAIIAIRTLHRRSLRAALRRKLIALGVPICVRCGYALRGLPATSLVCPECGTAIDASLRALIEADSPAEAPTTPTRPQ